jgi:hypothetical protein
MPGLMGLRVGGCGVVQHLLLLPLSQPSLLWLVVVLLLLLQRMQQRLWLLLLQLLVL